MKTRILIWVSTFFALLSFCNANARELITNGTFNTTTTSWTTSCTSVEASYYESTYGGSSSTNHVAEVDDESCFYQDVCILPGSSYTFSMVASRRIASSTPSTVTSHLKITGLNSSGSAVTTYVDMDYSRSNTSFAFTSVTGIPTIAVASGSGVVRLRILLSDNTTGYDTYGMIVDDLSLTFVTPPSIAGPDTTCMSAGTIYTVNDIASTGIYYSWTFGASSSPATSTLSNPSVSWSSGGMKTLIVILGNGVCNVDTESYAVYVGNGVTLNRYDTICSNSSYFFDGNTLTNAGNYTDTISGIGGCDSIINLHLFVRRLDTTYLFDSVCNGIGYAFNGNNYTSSGIYHDTFTSSRGCDSFVQLTLKILPTPFPPAVTTPVLYCQYDLPAPLTGVGSGLQWYSGPSGGTGSSSVPVPATTAPSDTYYYVSQTASGCESPRVAIKVVVTPKPVPAFNYSIVYGCNSDTVLFTNTSTAATAYSWYFDDGFQYPSFDESPVHYYPPVYAPRIRTVKLVASNGNCIDSSTVSITFLPNPNPPFSLTNVTADQAIVFGGSVQLNAAGAVIYYWQPNDGSLSDPNINNPVAGPRDSTTYVVFGYDKSGCRDSAVVHINVIASQHTFIPSAFSPNNDGKNDVFRVVGNAYEKLVDLSIFNRWGEKVFQTNDIRKGWDGTYHGEPQDLGVYFYNAVIATQEGANTTISGSVTLIR